MTDKPAKPDAEKLLPCPFCGLEWQGHFQWPGGAWARYTVPDHHSPDCPLRCNAYLTEAELFAAWNTRPLPTSLQPEQDQGVPYGKGSREPDQQAVPALRASIPDACTCAECGSPCRESKLGLPPACCWDCAGKIDARKQTKAAVSQRMGFCEGCHMYLPMDGRLCRRCTK